MTSLSEYHLNSLLCHKEEFNNRLISAFHLEMKTRSTILSLIVEKTAAVEKFEFKR